MGIKQKTGVCIDCPTGSREVPLIAKRCKNHYWQHRAKENTHSVKKAAKEARQAELKVFFANQTLVMPDKCEESGQQLPKSPAWLKKACIAHILPKRPDFGFPSVAAHPMNKIFLHPDIHSNMDNLGRDYIMKMKSLPVMKERVAILFPLLTPEEKNRVPEYFL